MNVRLRYDRKRVGQEAGIQPPRLDRFQKSIELINAMHAQNTPRMK
ncbi:hypothetical protein Pla100_39430 [Neorhodopirellula pilleata]|uniref:Uncharacterized protein n=1 Tax=Neorhodopirellula pilleata TaxID=2714738 RepID=A0A5C6A350_9BACT|nr:hypothetical protein Pla100_39430 [Neorhodopirellula pilleata]